MVGEGVAEEEERERVKAEIAGHPLYEQLLAAHVGCLRVATPIDQLPLIDAQLARSHNLLRAYSAIRLRNPNPIFHPHDRQHLDQFLNVTLIFSGATLGEGTGATMSDDEDDLQMDFAMDAGAEAQDMMRFGPLLPTESERSLMERVRQELKIELKQGFRSRIEDVREEILRKRRAGKLPGDTTSVLKQWWQQHSKWPYPTEDDKTRLVDETGLQLKQINNWFINQRKRNWHSNSQSVTCLKSKRKR
ncbi:hypothetical protein AMTRI_Chr09g16200 [Amborella trichopoda]